jgi:hypothetical protein
MCLGLEMWLQKVKEAPVVRSKTALKFSKPQARTKFATRQELPVALNLNTKQRLQLILSTSLTSAKVLDLHPHLSFFGIAPE